MGGGNSKDLAGKKQDGGNVEAEAAKLKDDVDEEDDQFEKREATEKWARIERMCKRLSKMNRVPVENLLRMHQAFESLKSNQLEDTITLNDIVYFSSDIGTNTILQDVLLKENETLDFPTFVNSIADLSISNNQPQRVTLLFKSIVGTREHNIMLENVAPHGAKLEPGSPLTKTIQASFVEMKSHALRYTRAVSKKGKSDVEEGDFEHLDPFTDLKLAMAEFGFFLASSQQLQAPHGDRLLSISLELEDDSKPKLNPRKQHKDKLMDKYGTTRDAHRPLIEHQSENCVHKFFSALNLNEGKRNESGQPLAFQLDCEKNVIQKLFQAYAKDNHRSYLIYAKSKNIPFSASVDSGDEARLDAWHLQKMFLHLMDLLHKRHFLHLESKEKVLPPMDLRNIRAQSMRRLQDSVFSFLNEEIERKRNRKTREKMSDAAAVKKKRFLFDAHVATAWAIMVSDQMSQSRGIDAGLGGLVDRKFILAILGFT